MAEQGEDKDVPKPKDQNNNDDANNRVNRVIAKCDKNIQAYNRNIPPEMIEKIVCNADGQTAMRLSRINKTWNLTCSGLGYTKNYWNQAARLEIEVPVLEQLFYNHSVYFADFIRSYRYSPSFEADLAATRTTVSVLYNSSFDVGPRVGKLSITRLPDSPPRSSEASSRSRVSIQSQPSTFSRAKSQSPRHKVVSPSLPSSSSSMTFSLTSRTTSPRSSTSRGVLSFKSPISKVVISPESSNFQFSDQPSPQSASMAPGAFTFGLPLTTLFSKTVSPSSQIPPKKSPSNKLSDFKPSSPVPSTSSGRTFTPDLPMKISFEALSISSPQKSGKPSSEDSPPSPQPSTSKVFTFNATPLSSPNSSADLNAQNQDTKIKPGTLKSMRLILARSNKAVSGSEPSTSLCKAENDPSSDSNSSDEDDNEDYIDGGAVGGSNYDAIDGAVGGRIDDDLDNAVGDRIDDAVGGSVADAVGGSTDGDVRGAGVDVAVGPDTTTLWNTVNLLDEDGGLIWPPRYDPWYQAYVKWFSGTLLAKKSAIRVVIDGALTNPITYQAMSGDVVIFGHRDGQVTINDYMAKTTQYTSFHCRQVTGIGLVNLTFTHHFRYSSTSIVNHHHIITVGRDSTICIYPIGPIGINTYDEVIRTSTLRLEDFHGVSVFGDRFIVYSKQLHFLVYKIALPKFVERGASSLEDLQVRLEMTRESMVASASETPGWIQLWRNTITLIDKKTSIETYNLSERRWDRHRAAVEILDQHVIGGRLIVRDSIRLANAYLFRDRIIFLCSSKGGFYVTLDNTLLHCLYQDRTGDAHVTAVGLYGSLLAVGDQRGNIYGFSVPSTSDILRIDFNKPMFVKRIDKDRGREPIIMLTVFNSGAGYAIAATTPSSCTIIQFRHLVENLLG